jgi:hypothetical protein
MHVIRRHGSVFQGGDIRQLSLGPIAGLAQEQEPGLRGGEAGRRGLEPVTGTKPIF